MSLDSYKDLVVWQKSIQLVKLIYSASKDLPKEELYGLTSQMRRCAVSIPSNIAEGYKRKGLGEYLNFLSYAEGSAAELETQLIIVSEVYSEVDTREIQILLQEVQKMLYALSKKIKTKS